MRRARWLVLAALPFLMGKGCRADDDPLGQPSGPAPNWVYLRDQASIEIALPPMSGPALVAVRIVASDAAFIGHNGGTFRVVASRVDNVGLVSMTVEGFSCISCNGVACPCTDNNVGINQPPFGTWSRGAAGTILLTNRGTAAATIIVDVEVSMGGYRDAAPAGATLDVELALL